MHDWTALRLDAPMLRLVYARWAELTDDAAPVSFQAPVAGAPQLLREWLDAVQTTEETGFGAWLQRAVEEEMFGVRHRAFGSVDGTLGADPVVASTFSGLVSLAERRGMTMTDGGNAKAEATNRRLRAVATHAVREFRQRYVGAAVAQLQGLVDVSSGGVPDPDRARATDCVLSALVSELLSTGFAASFLREHLGVLGGPETTGSEAKRWNAFLKRLTRAPGPTRAAVVVQCKRQFWAHWPGDTYESLGDVPAFGDAEPPNEVAPRFAPYGGRRVVEYEIEAQDHHAAANQAIARFQRTTDLVAAEVRRPSPDVLATAVRHGWGRGRTYSFADRDQLPLDPLPPRSAQAAPHGYARRMLAGDVEPSSLVRLQGALRAYRISREATYERTGLTNLWTALEALSPIEKEVSVIERVTGLVGPLMASFKAQSLVNDMVGVLRRHGVIGREVSPAGVVQVLTTDDGLAYVESLAAGDPVVSFHVRRFREAMGTGASLVAASYRTGRRVEWQVRRLYRLRNETVHGSSTPQNARRVLQHLLLYVNRAVLVLSELMLAEANGLRSIEAAASAIEVTYFEWAAWAKAVGDVSELDDQTRLLTPPFESLLE